MGTVIEFPHRYELNNIDGAVDREIARLLGAKVDEFSAAAEPKDKVAAACRAVQLALQRDTIKPDKFFLMYQEGDTIAYLNLNFAPDGMTKAIDLVLEHGLKDES